MDEKFLEQAATDIVNAMMQATDLIWDAAQAADMLVTKKEILAKMMKAVERKLRPWRTFDDKLVQAFALVAQVGAKIVDPDDFEPVKSIWETGTPKGRVETVMIWDESTPYDPSVEYKPVKLPEGTILAEMHTEKGNKHLYDGVIKGTSPAEGRTRWTGRTSEDIATLAEEHGITVEEMRHKLAQMEQAGNQAVKASKTYQRMMTRGGAEPDDVEAHIREVEDAKKRLFQDEYHCVFQVTDENVTDENGERDFVELETYKRMINGNLLKVSEKDDVRGFTDPAPSQLEEAVAKRKAERK